MADDTVREQLAREVTPELYREIRELWKAHSIAEDRRDIPGLLATLTDDCVYEIVPTGHRWEGLEGARRFYTELLGAFPDVKFHLQHIVIGPQGVTEEARVVATQEREWLGIPPISGRVEFTVVIFFPWDPARKKFAGERIHFDTGALRQE